MMSLNNEIRNELLSLKDEKYQLFQTRIIPNVPSERIIGVRTPDVRALCKKYRNNPQISVFLSELPHKYFEENNLHGAIIEKMKDYSEVIYALDNFLPYIDNWATCDMISPKVFAKQPKELMLKIKEWIVSDKTYTVRFAIGMLMGFYLDEQFTPEVNELVCSVKNEEYYVKMMVAWYFATALAKQYERTIPYIVEKRLEPWTHNKTIQKSIESYRITLEQKEYLKSLKVK